MTVVEWRQPYRGSPDVRVVEIKPFSARGMRRVYGRGDHLQRRTYNLDIWLDRHDRLLARFWSRRTEVTDEAWEIKGMPDAHLLVVSSFDTQWIPTCLRQQYENWITSNC